MPEQTPTTISRRRELRVWSFESPKAGGAIGPAVPGQRGIVATGIISGHPDPDKNDKPFATSEVVEIRIRRCNGQVEFAVTTRNGNTYYLVGPPNSEWLAHLVQWSAAAVARTAGVTSEQHKEDSEAIALGEHDEANEGPPTKKFPQPAATDGPSAEDESAASVLDGLQELPASDGPPTDVYPTRAAPTGSAGSEEVIPLKPA